MAKLEDVRRLLAAGVAAWAVGLIAACDSLDRDDGDDRSQDVISGGVDARPAAVPAAARVVKSGGGDLSYTPNTSGVAYITDQTAGRVILSHALASGQRLVVEPDRDRVMLDGRAIYQQNLERNNRHAVWWLPDDSAASDQAALPAELAAAQLAAVGTGDLSYTPPEDGRIFVWDPRSRQVIHRADVRRSDRVLVSPRAGMISVGTNARRQVQLDPDRPYEIYFERR